MLKEVSKRLEQFLFFSKKGSSGDVDTLLRLPTGIFYAQGVKANMLFFDKRQASSSVQTERLWVYDLRTNMNFTLRTNLLKREHLADFIACYHPVNRHQRQESERFHSFSYDELLKRDKLSLDLFWLRDESLEGTDKLPPPASLKTCRTSWNNSWLSRKIWERRRLETRKDGISNWEQGQANSPRALSSGMPL